MKASQMCLPYGYESLIQLQEQGSSFKLFPELFAPSPFHIAVVNGTPILPYILSSMMDEKNYNSLGWETTLLQNVFDSASYGIGTRGCW